MGFTFSGGSGGPGCDPGTVMTAGPGSISPTANKVKVEGSNVMRKGDSNPTVAFTCTISGTPTPFTAPVEIDNPGQTKVKAQ